MKLKLELTMIKKILIGILFILQTAISYGASSNNDEERNKSESHEQSEDESKKDFLSQWVFTISTSIITSIIASSIFYLIVNYFPEKKRKKKLRQKTDFEFNAIKNSLSRLFDNIMEQAPNIPSYYKSVKKSDSLTIEDLKTGLQNKCINEHYKKFKVYNAISPLLVSLKEPLKSTKTTTIELIDRILVLSQYLSADEILFLEEFREHLTSKYPFNDLDRKPYTQIGRTTYYDNNTTLVNSVNSFWELYNKYTKLKYYVYFKNSYSDWSVDISKISYLYNNQRYKSCKKHIVKAKRRHKNHTDLLDMYLFRTLFMLGKKKGAYNQLKAVLSRKGRLQLKYQRGHLKDFIDDPVIKSICIEKCSQKEFDEMLEVLENEKKQYQKFITVSNLIESYFNSKKNEQLSKNQPTHEKEK